MQKTYYIESEHIKPLLKRARKNYKVFLPAIKDNASGKPDYYCQLESDETPFLFNPYRTVEPLKSFFTPPYENLADYFTQDKEVTPVVDKTIVFGVKSCDIYGHKIQDFVFLQGVEVDSLYRLKRDNTILISGDCTDYKEVCHCLAWDVLPYPTEGFDLNFSPLTGGFLVDVGSERGDSLIKGSSEYFKPAKESQLAARKEKRDRFVKQLNQHLLPQKLVTKKSVQELVRNGYNSDTWQEFMLTCVECGGCNLICDTCHCFLLADKKDDSRINKKVRVWDSCLYANYARVAGGANPLKTRAQRLRNRFMKKFDFFVDNLDMPACCGCGRCIEVCPGKIDIREVLKDLAKKKGDTK